MKPLPFMAYHKTGRVHLDADAGQILAAAETDEGMLSLLNTLVMLAQQAQAEERR